MNTKEKPATKRPQAATPQPILLCAKEAAALAGVTVKVFRKWDRAGLVKRTNVLGLKNGKFHVDDIREALQKMRRPTETSANPK